MSILIVHDKQAIYMVASLYENILTQIFHRMWKFILVALCEMTAGSQLQTVVSRKLNSPKYRIKGSSPVYIYFIVMYTHLC